MIIAILGRITTLGIAECERVFGSENVQWFGDNAALIEGDSFNVERFGSIIKSGRIVTELPRGDWQAVSKKLIQAYTEAWSGHEHKITLGISAYNFSGVTARDIGKTGLVLKQKLKKSPGSLRLIPNEDIALNSATSHHNKLGLSDNKVELLVVRDAKSGRIVIAESLGAQNITALARRDQGRPKRDAFVGMLPPKLALTMVNLAYGQPEDSSVDTAKRTASFSEDSAFPAGARQDHLQLASSGSEEKDGGTLSDSKPRILDPFCGTGVILQEAALLGFNAYGTDLAEKMVDFSRINLDWLKETHRTTAEITIEHGDAMTAQWQSPIDAVACESYLGQPFSAPPSPGKLRDVRGNCDHIISKFLKNIADQLEPGTPLCVAIPAWRDVYGRFTHLPLIEHLDELGYTQYKFSNIASNHLLYYREEQVVARELLVLERT